MTMKFIVYNFKIERINVQYFVLIIMMIADSFRLSYRVD